MEKIQNLMGPYRNVLKPFWDRLMFRYYVFVHLNV